jgi:hypothetical protein
MDISAAQNGHMNGDPDAQKAAQELAAKAAEAVRVLKPASPAMVTLEAVEPEGNLADAELVLLAADHLDGE